jgi:drug/metabolite transporter (DMT)-like permease
MMIIASIFLSLSAALVKYIRYLPLMEITFFLNLPAMIIAPVLLKYKNIPFYGNNKIILLLRCFLGFISMVGYYFTCTKMYLSDAITIQQLAPFFIIILAIIILKEKIIFQQIPMLILAFSGALFVVRPGFRFDMIPVIIGVLAALFGAGAQITLRVLRLTDEPLVIVIYRVYSAGLVALVILFFQNSFVVPDLYVWPILLLMGLVFLIGQITLTNAYRLTPASLVSLYLYSQIIFGTIYGFLFFRELPGIYSILGSSLIIISGFFNYRIKTKK